MRTHIPTLLGWFCFVLILHPNHSIAQDKLIDSLEQSLEQSTNDSLSLELLKKLTNLTAKTNVKKYLFYIQEGIQLAEKIQDCDRLIGFNVQYSQYLAHSHTLDSALSVIEQARSYLTETIHPQNYLALLTQHAKLLERKGNIPEATRKYLEALKIAEEHQIPEALAACYIGLNSLFYSQKMYAESIKYNKKCLGICDQLKPHRVPYCFGIVHNNLALFYFKQQQLDSALIHGLKAIEFKEKTRNIRDLYMTYNIVGHAYLKKKDTLTAIDFHNKALATVKKMNHIIGLSETLTYLGKIYIKRKDTKALNSIIPQLDSIMPKIQAPHIWINFLQVKRNYFEAKEDYKEALKLVKMQFEMVDSLRKEENSTLVASLETKYETNKHKLEKELAQKELLLSKEKALKSKQYFMGITLFSILITVLLLYIASRLTIIRQQKVALNQAYEELEAQKQNEVALLNLKALQAQMNPHFLFNALNSIQDLILMKDTKNAIIYFGKYSALIRKILLSSQKQFITLDKEIETLQLYLDLEKLRFGKDLITVFNCPIPPDQQTDIHLPAMFIQPYIENAIKHGLFHKRGSKKLLVEFKIVDNFLVCLIEDNGIGQEKAKEIKEKRQHLHTGFATGAIQDRIQFLNQTMKKEIRVETEDLIEGGQALGTRVTLYFSLAE